MSRTGLVLEGGGMRGLYSAGVLDTMMDRGFLPDVICGTSAGVTFGVNLPSGQKSRVLRYNTLNAGNPDFISLRSLLKTGNIVNAEFAYDRLPHELDPFDNAAFKASGVEFYATVTNVRTGQAEYMLIDDCDEKMDIIRASASMPFVSKKVYIDGTPYLDGGIVDNIPLDKCLSLGCERIIVVLTHSLAFVRKGSAGVAARLFYQRDTKLVEAMSMRSKRYNRCMERIRSMEASGKIFVIAPESELAISRLESDPVKMRAAHNLGMEDAERLWDRMIEYLGNATKNGQF